MVSLSLKVWRRSKKIPKLLGRITPRLWPNLTPKPSAYGPIVGTIITNENYGAVFEKGSKVRAPVNAAIAALTKDGTIGKLQKKWFNLNFASLPVIK